MMPFSTKTQSSALILGLMTTAAIALTAAPAYAQAQTSNSRASIEEVK